MMKRGRKRFAARTSEQLLVGGGGTRQLSGSVGRGGGNRPDDVRLVQRLINANLPIPLTPLDEDGVCGSQTIFAIETYQQRSLGMSPPDGRVDPGGATFQSLTGARAPLQPPSPTPVPGPVAAGEARPPNMGESAWRYLLEFTNKHEQPVFNMYNNRPPNSKKQDVTCGVGFRLDPRSVVTQDWVKSMFFDQATGQTPSDDQMLADWDAAARLARTRSNLPEYHNVCRMRMFSEKVYRHMAVILRDQKLPALLKRWPDDFADFPNFPAAAQVFCLSFAYGFIPHGKDPHTSFRDMRAAIRAGRWADASKECRLKGCSEAKNRAHAELLLLAQRVVDEGLDFDTLPPL